MNEVKYVVINLTTKTVEASTDELHLANFYKDYWEDNYVVMTVLVTETTDIAMNQLLLDTDINKDLKVPILTRDVETLNDYMFNQYGNSDYDISKIPIVELDAMINAVRDLKNGGINHYDDVL